MADDDKVISFAAKRALAGEGDVTKWQPRDLLQYFIDEIDAGRQFDGMIVAYAWNDHENKRTLTGLMRSQFTVVTTLGILECCKHDLMQSTDVE